MNLQAEPLHLKEATVTCIPRLRGGGGRSRRRGGSSAASPTQVSGAGPGPGRRPAACHAPRRDQGRRHPPPDGDLQSGGARRQPSCFGGAAAHGPVL
jgi:hypothetical protein